MEQKIGAASTASTARFAPLARSTTTDSLIGVRSLRRDRRGAAGIDVIEYALNKALMPAETVVDNTVANGYAKPQKKVHTYIHFRLAGLWLGLSGLLGDGSIYATTHLMPQVASMLDLGRVQPETQGLMFAGAALNFLANYMQMHEYGYHFNVRDRIRIALYSSLHDIAFKSLLRLGHDAKSLPTMCHDLKESLVEKVRGARGLQAQGGAGQTQNEDWGE